MRKLLALIGAAFIFFGVYGLARSEECQLPFTAFVEQVTAEGATVKPITNEEKAQLYAKKGPPPIDEPFTIDVARTDTAGVIVVVKDDCVVARVGPVPLQLLDNFLGDSGA